MKISEMNVNQATETMIRISEPIANLCDDEDMLALMDEIAKSRNVPLVKMVAKILPKVTAIGLQNHRDDLFEIISALLLMPKEKVGEMNFAEMIKALRNSVDDVLTGFFTPSASAQKTDAEE